MAGGITTDSSTGIGTVQAALAEILGTAFLVFTIVLTGVHTHGSSATDPDTTTASGVAGFVAVGLTLAALLYSLEHVSGASFNPAITISMGLLRKQSFISCMVYIVAQVLGGCLGGALAGAIASPAHIGAFSPASGSAQDVTAAWVVEFIFSFALVLVIQCVVSDKNAREPNAYFGLAVGAVVAAGGAAAGRISGGAFNPAVALGAQLASVQVHSDLTHLWVYLTAPLAAAVVATLMKQYMNADHLQGPSIGGLPLVVPIVEALGTFLLTATAAYGAGPLGVGLILLALIYSADNVCGVDFNPAVTLGAAMRWGVGISEYWKVAVTVLAQFAGAFGAAYTVWGTTGHVTWPHPAGGQSSAGAFIFEAVWTTLLVYVVCSVMTPISSDADDLRQMPRRGMATGFVLAGGISAAGPAGGGSGGAFNPALGAALACAHATAGQADTVEGLWVYLFAPLIGSVCGAGLFALLHSHTDPDPAEYDVLFLEDALAGANAAADGTLYATGGISSFGDTGISGNSGGPLFDQHGYR